MPYSHRHAHADDLPAIVAIYNSTIASRQVTADTAPISVASRLGWFAEHAPERRPLWVVEADTADGAKTVIGWLSFSDFYGRPAYAGSAEVSIYLHHNARGQGLGSYLLIQALAVAPALSIHTLLGFIFGHNTPSLKLFQSCGFASWGQLPRVALLDGIERDLIIVGKRVT